MRIHDAWLRMVLTGVLDAAVAREDLVGEDLRLIGDTGYVEVVARVSTDDTLCAGVSIKAQAHQGYNDAQLREFRVRCSPSGHRPETAGCLM